jgi:SAM-dependent methyltransferase
MKIIDGGGGSGGGSEPNFTLPYRQFLSIFLKEKNIKSVVDYGCGDWQSSRLINFDGIEYLGIDIVDSIIKFNIENYSKENIKFKILDNFEDFFDYTADLLILKDCIQHWKNSDIDYFLPKVIDNFKYILINNSSRQLYDNQDTPVMNRPLSAKFEPLKKYMPKILFTYNDKEISIITKN